MGSQKWFLLRATLLLYLFLTALSSPVGNDRTVIQVDGGPSSVVWVVQLSDLHFSVFHPERADDLRRYVGPALSMINPSLVLITGDLTDGKSKDLLTMKQEEREWIEYENVTRDVIQASGLSERIFFDLRGNHDSFGVPIAGGEYDFYERYSINARLGRNGTVQSVTLQNGIWKHLFVGIDTTIDKLGLRGPTNLFGHPTDQLLSNLDKSLSQWDSDEFTPYQITKLAFGHFPLSFTALTETEKTLKQVFLKHSISAYLCGHLHTRFGNNLKRHHSLVHRDYFQYNIHQASQNQSQNTGKSDRCSRRSMQENEFWEWEMGDWRKSHSMRVLAIDSGRVSYTDINFKFGSKDIIILLTFPLDSRFMQRISSPNYFNCKSSVDPSFETIRVLVFSKHKILSVWVRVYDSRSGSFHLVLESEMKQMGGKNNRGELYFTPWHWRAFVDPSPDRYWIQIQVRDVSGGSSTSQMRPFSINGLTARVSWTWREFYVMGCQWAVIYQPAFWSLFVLALSLVLIPRFIFLLSKDYSAYMHLNPKLSKRLVLEFSIRGVFWVLTELTRMTLVWYGFLIYLVYLLLFPWFYGHVFTEKGKLMYMTYKGWSDSSLLTSGIGDKRFGIPDVMVLVLPHFCFVVLPAILVTAGLAAERIGYKAYMLSLSGKKEDDGSRERKRDVEGGGWNGRWIRKFLLFCCLFIFWKHWKQCSALMKAYEMNPFVHAPIYFFVIPALLIYSILKTSI